MSNTYNLIIIVTFSGLMASCSPSSVLSSSSALGAALGAGTGVAAGALIADQDPSIDGGKAAVALGGIAAAAGMTAGGMIEDNRVEKEKEQYFQRVPYAPNKTQEEIDNLRQQINDGSTWGKNEVRPYEERYQIERDRSIYQGSR